MFAFLSNDGVVELASDAFSAACAWNGDLAGVPILELLTIDAKAEDFLSDLRSCFSGERVFDEFRCSVAPGRSMSLTAQFVPYGPEGRTASALLLLRDITYVKRLEERIQVLEYRDMKTGLPNRRSLELLISKEIARAQRSSERPLRAVLFISLENFARINQTYGHEIGDILLENSGIRIKDTIVAELLRDGDYVFETDSPTASFADQLPRQEGSGELVFRFEGREFAAVLTDIARETDAAVVAMRIARSVSLPYRDKYGAEIFINCNIGIAIYPHDGRDKETLIQHSASAMHEAKRLGAEFLLFNPSMHENALAKMRLAGSIYSGFIESQFSIHYQPVVDYAGVIVGAEALVRWNHPERGMIMPSEFIALAAEKGFMVNIGKRTLYTVIKLLERLPKDIYVSVNLCAQEIEHQQAVESILRALAGSPTVDPSRLKIEITESDSMRNPGETFARMEVLRNAGVGIFIDDFGTGHSSLTYLKDIPASTMKVDRSFVASVAISPEDRKFLEGIIDLAVSRGKAVILEGVETEEQLAVVRRMKPTYIQGFYFSGAVPADEFERMAAARVRLPRRREGG